ncbi:MAG TPA: threonine--tRNA ligase [Candidatus Saccharimonadales bacterium]|nr:threonine--tRNA ligase [Candidatus Saccharimonadales bacterium]
MKHSSLETMRHSTAHLLAAAVKKLYPNTKLGVGPTIDDGFYYDFSFEKPISSDELPKIEAKMRELAKDKLPYTKTIKKIDEAISFVDKEGETFKKELIEDLQKEGEKEVSFYQTGEFIDLCTGPHVDNTSELKAFKLLSLAATYWKGSEKNASLTRIYGTAWESDSELKDYLERVERSKENDNRKVGKELDLFVFSDVVGKGLPMLTSKGASIRRELERFIVDEEIRRGYEHVITPPLAKVDLYKKSGHYPYYKDTMYPTMKVDEEELILRPMTCPHHFILYKDKLHSYRELPLKIAEVASQFRYEKSGELSGLMRVRMFTLTDAHIICTKEQAKGQIKEVLELIDFVNEKIGLKKGEDYRYRLSLGNRSDEKKYYKDDKSWEEAEKVLRETLKETDSPFFEAENEAAFYGPKIDVQIKNVLGKEETAFTIQYDFVQPKRFELTYIDENGKEKEPVVIHRSSLGALERTMAFLLEKTGGKLPFWLSPIQFAVIPIADRHLDYAQEVNQKLLKNKLRSLVNSKSEPLGAKIREAQLQKIPYMLILGDKEQAQKNISVRNLNGENLGSKDLESFTQELKKELPNG